MKFSVSPCWGLIAILVLSMKIEQTVRTSDTIKTCGNLECQGHLKAFRLYKNEEAQKMLVTVTSQPNRRTYWNVRK